jgi:hypothetical protein
VAFDPTSVPEGCRYRPVTFWRPLIKPRSIFAHTMAAPGRSSVQSAWNHANAAPNSNTLPHYALGLDEADGCEKFLPTNRRGIGNATVDAYQGTNPDLSWFSLVVETADTGTNADPTISAFTDYQLEMLTRVYVHEATGWAIPAVKLPTWYGAGMATHTDPFGYPYTTLYQGKFCPGSKKKAQFWSEVLPEVQRRMAPPEVVDVNWNPDAATVSSINAMPGVADTLAGKYNTWAVIGLIKAVQELKGLPVTGKADQATWLAVNEVLA